MDILNMLEDLRAEKARVEEAIITLERLAAGSAPRRGRPPKWLAAVKAERPQSTPGTRRRPFSAETRKKMAAAQRKRWAARKTDA